MTNLIYASPFFIVASIKTSVSFYVDKLGFEVRYIGPEDDPFFAIVGRDEVSIMLKEIAADVKPVPNHTRHKWGQPIQDDDDGLRGFEVMDADGYVLFFGRPRSLVS